MINKSMTFGFLMGIFVSAFTFIIFYLSKTLDNDIESLNIQSDLSEWSVIFKEYEPSEIGNVIREAQYYAGTDKERITDYQLFHLGLWSGNKTVASLSITGLSNIKDKRKVKILNEFIILTRGNDQYGLLTRKAEAALDKIRRQDKN